MSSWQPLVRQKDATVIATGPVNSSHPRESRGEDAEAIGGILG